ncbi:MAG: CocE/NonD family hydrolase [Acidobacteriaceae bacterium]
MAKAVRRLICSLALASVLCIFGAARAQTAPLYPNYPSETPTTFHPPTYGMNYTRRDVMIPMRDGVKLHTVILVPKGATHAGILLTRTPYSATELTTNAYSTDLGTSLWGYDNATETIVNGGYIRVVQDIRGKYGSQGGYVMNRPFRGPLNPTPVDESTDTYDTIDWLVKNVPESNGKVGVLGISYDGFLSLTPLVHPHPALKCVVPMNPMVDGWRGDDWFHNGAFREEMMPYIYEQTATRDNSAHWLTSNFDVYDTYMNAVSAGSLGKQRNMDQLGFWRKLTEHPAYDGFWRDQAVDRVLAAQPFTVPTMLVASLWDQEDIYGALAVYRALAPKDPDHSKLYLVIGPWHHGQEIEHASSLGAIHFHSDTGLYFREHLLAPFLAHYLRDDPPPLDIAPVTAFVTGADHWESLESWPSGCKSGCTPTSTPLYLQADGKLAFTTPTNAASGDIAFDEYVSDPAKPVPYRTRPSQPVGYTPNLSWVRWLVDDQRPFSGRTDVLTYKTPVLTAPIKISGRPIVHLIASTSGTDSDWVVKLIDVYPPQVAGRPELGGYQLPISMDIFRGRYRTSISHPQPIASNVPLLYKFDLPTANHVFLPGHRIMVQVQSSWFPLYDRNPQTYVPNIFFAKPADYKEATERVYHAPGDASFIELPVVNIEPQWLSSK